MLDFWGLSIWGHGKVSILKAQEYDKCKITFWAQVFATLVHLLFSVDNLKFDKMIDHVETFAGQMSVTKAEWDVTCPRVQVV